MNARPEEQTPSDAALAFLASMVASLLLLGLLGLSTWSLADQWIAVVAVFLVTWIVSARLRDR